MGCAYAYTDVQFNLNVGEQRPGRTVLCKKFTAVRGREICSSNSKLDCTLFNGEEQPIFHIVLSLPAPQPALTLPAQEPQHGPAGPAGDPAVRQATEGEVRESAAGAGKVREGLSG